MFDAGHHQNSVMKQVLINTDSSVSMLQSPPIEKRDDGNPYMNIQMKNNGIEGGQYANEYDQTYQVQ